MLDLLANILDMFMMIKKKTHLKLRILLFIIIIDAVNSSEIKTETKVKQT